MALLTIAGVAMPNPAELRVGRFDLTKAERAADGTMHIEVIRADIIRLDVAWRWITSSELTTILNALSANLPFFAVTFEDAGGPKTVTCYRGDRNQPMRRKLSGTTYWDFEVALIQQ